MEVHSPAHLAVVPCRLFKNLVQQLGIPLAPLALVQQGSPQPGPIHGGETLGQLPDHLQRSPGK